MLVSFNSVFSKSERILYKFTNKNKKQPNKTPKNLTNKKTKTMYILRHLLLSKFFFQGFGV